MDIQNSDFQNKMNEEIMQPINPLLTIRSLNTNVEKLINFYNTHLKNQMYEQQQNSILYYFGLLSKQSKDKVIQNVQASLKVLEKVMSYVNNKKKREEMIQVISGYVKLEYFLKKKNSQWVIQKSSKQGTQSVKQRENLQKCKIVFFDSQISQLILTIVNILLLIPQYNIFTQTWTTYKYTIVGMGVFVFVYSLVLLAKKLLKKWRELSEEQEQKPKQNRTETKQRQPTESGSNFGFNQGRGRELAVIQLQQQP